MPVYFARAKVRAVEKYLEPCRRLDLRVTAFMSIGRRSMPFLPPGRCRTSARDHQHHYQQKTKQHAHVLSSSCSLYPAVSRQCAILSWQREIEIKDTSLARRRMASGAFGSLPSAFRSHFLLSAPPRGRHHVPMNSPAFGLRIASAIFALFAGAHVVRLVEPAQVTVCAQQTPMSLSVVALIIAAILSIWLWRLSSAHP